MAIMASSMCDGQKSRSVCAASAGVMNHDDSQAPSSQSGTKSDISKSCNVLVLKTNPRGPPYSIWTMIGCLRLGRRLGDRQSSKNWLCQQMIAANQGKATVAVHPHWSTELGAAPNI